MKFLNFITIFFILSLKALHSSQAIELQERFDDWTVFKTQRGDRLVCYSASTPIKKEGNHEKRGEPFFLVTEIENDADEVSTSSGFYYNQDSNIEISFGSKKFYLFPFKATAWANNKNDDIDIIKEMQKNADMIVTGFSKDGKNSVDTYSLIGFNESYKRLKNICKQ